MLDYLKPNIKFIITFVIIIIIIIVSFKIKLFFVEKQICDLEEKNSKLSSSIIEKNSENERLIKNISKLEAIIKENEKQKEIEDKILEEQRIKENEINQTKDRFYNDVIQLKEKDNEFKNWCEEPVPISITSNFTSIVR